MGATRPVSSQPVSAGAALSQLTADVVVIASGMPWSPSRATIHTSCTPRFWISVRTFSQSSTSGASTCEPMHRMGHSSMRAPLTYQHATDERSQESAERLDGLLRRERGVARAVRGTRAESTPRTAKLSSG